MSLISLESNPLHVVEKVWEMLVHGKKTYNTPFHQAQVATVDEHSCPQVRTMILREAIELQSLLQFNLDVRSPKAAQIQANANVQCLFYDAQARVQVKATCTAKICYHDDISNIAWQKARVQSQLSYNTADAPSTKLLTPVILDVNRTDATKEELEAAKSNFAVLQCRITHLDILSLHHVSNLRIGYDCRTKEATWLHP
jgi:pyridoxamine 5'-phosphate oxidase